LRPDESGAQTTGGHAARPDESGARTTGAQTSGDHAAVAGGQGGQPQDAQPQDTERQGGQTQGAQAQDTERQGGQAPGSQARGQEAASGLPTPLGEAERAIFYGSPEDPPPKKLGGVTEAQEGRHYVAGNEWNLHLFYRSLRRLGGGYLGVGTDQAYVFVGWQHPELAWLMDYDPWVRRIHAIYFAFFAQAETPREFLSLWRKDATERAFAAIEARGGEDVPRLKRLYRSYRTKILMRLTKVRDEMREAKVPTFLNSKRTYRWVRAFVLSGRARAMTGNLLGARAMKGIGEAARRLGVPIRAVYVSNAEQYWKYGRRYRENVAALYTDDKTLMVRTLLTWERNRDYRYTVQPWDNFLAWLSRPWVTAVYKMIPARTDDSKDVEFFVFRRTVESAERRRSQRTKKPTAR